MQLLLNELGKLTRNLGHPVFALGAKEFALWGQGRGLVQRAQGNVAVEGFDLFLWLVSAGIDISLRSPTSKNATRTS